MCSPPRIRYVKLRTLNVSHTALMRDLQHHAEVRFARLDRQYADRHGDDAFQKLNKRLYDMALDGDDMPSAGDYRPRGHNRQAVKSFRPLTLADRTHPDAFEFFDPSELAEVIDEAAEMRVGSPALYKHVDYITPEGGGSRHSEMVGFMNEAQEKSDIACKAAIEKRKAKAKRRAERAGLKYQEIVASGDPVAIDEAEKAKEQAKKHAEINRALKQEIADRIKYGFYRRSLEQTIAAGLRPDKVAGERFLGEHYEDEIHEYFGEDCPYRSKLGSPSLARMAALYPRKGRIRGGNDKEALLETSSKLLALDSPYVELNKLWLGCIVVETDGVWPSAAAFRAKLLEKLGPRMMPNLMVGRYSKDGQFVRPHLIWILKTPVYNAAYREWTDPDTGEVHSVGNKACSTKAISKFHAVQRSLVSMLVDVGADPACHNIWKPKCPLSPLWSTVITNDDYWASLDDFRHIPGYPKRAPSEYDMAKLATEMRENAAGTAPVTSNVIWNTTKTTIDQLMSRARRGMDLDFRRAAQQGTPALAAYIDNTVRPELVGVFGEIDALDRILHRQGMFSAAYYRRMERKNRPEVRVKTNEDGMKIKKIVWRGRDSGVISLIPEIDVDVDADRRNAIEAEIKEKHIEAKLVVAGQRSAAHVSAKKFWDVGKAIVVWLDNGGEESWDAFRRSGQFECCVNTARKYWTKFFADRKSARQAASVSSAAPTQAGAARYIAIPSSGETVALSSPLPSIQTSVSVVGRPRITVGQFFSSDPPASSLRHPVNQLHPSGPPGSASVDHAPSTADLRHAVSQLVPEPA